MSDRYDQFASLTFDQPGTGILRITLDAPGLNAVSEQMHRELADVWLTIDRDPDVRVRHPAGRRQGVLRGRQLRAARRDHQRLRGARPRHARGARPRLQRHQLLEADRLRHPWPRGRRRSRGGDPRRRLDRHPHGPHHRRPHAARRRGRRPRGDLLAVAVRHGEGEVLPADLRDAHRRRGGAHRPRLAGRRGRPSAGEGARGGRERSPAAPSRPSAGRSSR